MPELIRFCEHCDEHRARAGREYCSRCYADGAAQREPLVTRGVGDYSRLADTGLRVDDETGELVHPDGRRERAPRQLVYRVYFEDVGDGRYLKVLRPCVEEVQESEEIHDDAR